MKNDLNEIETALCRSAIYEVLANGFLFPTTQAMENIFNNKKFLELYEIVSLLNEDFANRIEGIRQAPDFGNLLALQDCYYDLFGHTARARVPLYETVYGEESLFQQPQELGDLTGFYTAFGLKLNRSQHERVDHISCQCEFLAFLARKEAYAIENDKVEMAEDIFKAQKFFLRDHLGKFVPALAKLLENESGKSFYGKLGKLCYDFVLAECSLYNVKAGSEFLQLNSNLETDEDCFTCGGGDDAIKTCAVPIEEE
ncbi:molecular chaperone TorD family protein [bacterium]|nr:molecular chaperone TorD family protein [bacterium]